MPLIWLERPTANSRQRIAALAAFAPTRPVYGAAPVAGQIKGFFSTLIANTVAWNDQRVTRKALHALTARELEDIGLSRGDIDTVAIK